jgi:hypothetical protein
VIQEYSPEKERPKKENNKGVCHTCGLAIYIIKKLSILRQKRRIIENSNISPCNNIIFKKSSKKKPKSNTI